MTATVSTWRCLACPEHGEGDRFLRDAERHLKQTSHSGYVTSTVPRPRTQATTTTTRGTTT